MITIGNKVFNTIFLDRDGVINIERKDDYVKTISEFVFEKNALEAISILSQAVKKIFIVTNQRGVGRGVMSINDLGAVHDYMCDKINAYGGNISDIYFCTDIDTSSINRKPNIGMAFQAKRDYTCIEFDQSIMIGNSRSDIDFGKKINAYSVLVGDKYSKENEIYQIADAYYENLYEFALSL